MVFLEMGGAEGGLRYLKRCLQAVPASLFSVKDYTLLSIEFFFLEKRFQKHFLDFVQFYPTSSTSRMESLT